MQNREKQIEGMARVIHDSDLKGNDTFPMCLSDCLHKHGGTRTNEAVALYNAGYRKSTDVAEEIFAEIDAEICNELEKADDETIVFNYDGIVDRVLDKLKKKYTQDKGRDKIAEFGKYSPLSWRNTEEGK